MPLLAVKKGPGKRCAVPAAVKHQGLRVCNSRFEPRRLCVEHNGVQIVSDPWLISSCYWRSWWHFPEPPAALIENLKPDYITSRTCTGTISTASRSRGYSLRTYASSCREFLPGDATGPGMARLPQRRRDPHGSQVRLGETSFSGPTGWASALTARCCLQRRLYSVQLQQLQYFGLPFKQITKPDSQDRLRAAQSFERLAHPLLRRGLRGRLPASAVAAGLHRRVQPLRPLGRRPLRYPVCQQPLFSA